MDEKYIALAQKWHTKGWNARQGEIDELKAEIKKLRNLVGQAGCDIDAYQEGISELKTQLAVYKEDMQRDAERIAGLQNRIHDAELQIAVHWGADEDTDSVLRDVEKALRGANA
jgi:chromosome segregation ATPase